jgi:transcriptional regulator with XRE-family HTH domain
LLKQKIEYLLSLGFTQAAIARNANINAVNLNKWLKGERPLSREAEQKLTAWLEKIKKDFVDF